jgi:hypothetical protein
MKEHEHKWKITDDIVAFYLYKCGSMLEIEHAAKKLGIKTTSMKMRVSNFAFLDSDKGLKKYSKQSKTVYFNWKNSTIAELKAEYDNIISKINKGQSSGI